MKTLVAVAGFLVVLVAAPFLSTGLACRCRDGQPTSSSYEHAHAVIVAKVSSVSGDIEKPGGLVAVLQVEGAWKAPVDYTIRASTATTCAFDFRAGHEYLLFLVLAADRSYTTARCLGNQPLGSAKGALAWLKEHGKPSRVGDE